MIRVSRVKALDDFSLELLFSDGRQKSFDMKPFLDYPVFQPLKDLAKFKDVRIAYGTVQWGGEQDMSPDTLYLEGVEINETVSI